MLASVHYYLFNMRVKAPLMFGIRRCFHCPYYNVDEHDVVAKKLRNHVVFTSCACQSIFGSNGKLMGGYAGLGQALCFANQAQSNQSPLFGL